MPDHMLTTGFRLEERVVKRAGDLVTDRQAKLFETWRSRMELGGYVAAPPLDALDFRGVLGFVHVLDVLEEAQDFHYRIYGTMISQAAGHDWHHHQVSELPATISGPLLTHYRRVVDEKVPIVSVAIVTGNVMVREWLRLSLPWVAGGDTSRVGRITVVCEPRFA